MFEKAAYILYLIVLVITPVLFGGFPTYAYTIMTFGVFLATLAALFAATGSAADGGRWVLGIPSTGLNLFFIVTLIFLILQMIPLPEEWVRILSPESWKVLKKTTAPLSEAAGLNPPIRYSLAPYVYPVRMALIRFAVYGLFFFGMLRVLNTRKRIETAVALILVLCCAETLYGIVEAYSGSNRVLWFSKPPGRVEVSGTFINRNHFAGLMEMGFLLAIGYFAGLAGRRKRTGGKDPKGAIFRKWALSYLEGERRFNKRLLALFFGVIIGVGLILSGSRGGMLSVAGGTLFMGLMFLFKERHRRKGFVALAVFLCTLIYALQIGIEDQIGRFENFEEDFETRSEYARNTMDIFRDYPVAGAGFGSFRYIYPGYQSAADTRL